jgi:hypothetical protein
MERFGSLKVLICIITELWMEAVSSFLSQEVRSSAMERITILEMCIMVQEMVTEESYVTTMDS